MKFWDKQPDRDEVLDEVYEVIRGLSVNENEADKAEIVAIDENLKPLKAKLRTKIEGFMQQYTEDDETIAWDGNLNIIDDPEKLDEVHTQPRFSGNKLLCEKGENVSVRIGVKGTVSLVRLHFELKEADELYFLKLYKIDLDQLQADNLS